MLSSSVNNKKKSLLSITLKELNCNNEMLYLHTYNFRLIRYCVNYHKMFLSLIIQFLCVEDEDEDEEDELLLPKINFIKCQVRKRRSR